MRIYSDTCYNCGAYKTEVEASRRSKDPRYCATVDYWGECINEWPRHIFVVTEAQLKADEEAELEHLRQMGEFADFVRNEESKTLPKKEGTKP